MILYWRISTPSVSARRTAPGSGSVLKAMITPFEADASCTSDSFTVPTEAWMTRTLTSSTLRSSRVRATGSSEPCTSTLSTMLNACTAPRLISPKSESRVTAARCATPASASRRRWSASRRASRSVLKVVNRSPAGGTSESPRTTAGDEGPACCRRLPAASSIALILP